MEILRLSAPLILSRLGDMAGSLIFFSFTGHYMVNSLSSVSFALASISFLTVIGIGFFSNTSIVVAGSRNLNTDNIKSEIAASFNLAIFFGLSILCIIFIAVSNLSNLEIDLGTPEDFKALLILTTSIPAIYLQITIFNVFNGIRKTQYELTYTWLLNAILSLSCIIFINTESNINLSDFMITYVFLRYLFSCFALIFFKITIPKYINNFSIYKKITKENYAKYMIHGFPMALCFGCESLLFFLFSMMSKHISDISLSAYQASIHAASIIFMISIGIGNATGIIIARHYTRKDFRAISKTYTQGVWIGLLILTPTLTLYFLLNENISLIYTSDTATRILIEKNIITSIPFLIFEFIYIITRLTLRSMNDHWTPTIMTILALNVFGVFSSATLLSLYEYTVHSIFLALIISSFTLMLLLSWRLRKTLKHAKKISKLKKTFTAKKQP